MAALHSLLAIYGAIDQMVLEDPEAASEIAARYLPAYADEGAPGWFQEIVGLTNEHRAEGVASVSFPDLSEALGTFTDIDTDVPAPQLARLVLAVAMIQRLDPGEHYVSREQLVAALVPVTPDYETSTADALFELLADDEVFPSQEAWSEMMARAVDEGLLSTTLAVVPAPCTGGYTVVMVRGVPRLVSRLETDFTNPNATLDGVRAVLDPLNWDNCCEYFCSMAPLPPDAYGWRQTLEEFSTLCSAWSLFTGLRYWRMDLAGGGAALNYDLCLDQPPGDDGLTLVDRGAIVVRPAPGGGVRIRTTKEVLFDGIGSEAIALFACIGGWADVGYDLLFGCTPEGPGWEEWATDEAPQSSPESDRPRPRSRPRAEPAPSTVPPSAFVDETVDWLTTCIDELSTKTGAYARRAADGSLTVDDVVSFTADLGARMLSDPWRAVDVATRAARARADRASPPTDGKDGKATGESAEASEEVPS